MDDQLDLLTPPPDPPEPPAPPVVHPWGPDEFPDSMTLGEARAKMAELLGIDLEQRPHGIVRAEAEVICPCCTRLAKVYDKRKLNSAMAARLIGFYRQFGVGEWFHSPSFARNDGDTGKLGYWHLVEEERTIRRPDGGRAGYWRVTPTGQAFVRGEITVPKFAVVYDKVVLQLTGEPINIRQALGSKFDYAELMGHRMEEVA